MYIRFQDVWDYQYSVVLTINYREVLAMALYFFYTNIKNVKEIGSSSSTQNKIKILNGMKT